MASNRFRIVDGAESADDQPSPPTQAELDLGIDIERVISHLGSAHGADTPFHLVAVLSLLGSRVRRPSAHRPAEEDVNRMLEAARRARFDVLKFIDDAVTISANGHLGMDAVQALICLWGGTPETAAARHPHQVDDILDHGLIFRREMQIAVTMQAIERRVAERRADPTGEIWRGFDAAAAF